LRLAETAYGSAVRRYLDLVLAKFAADSRYASACARSLGIEDLGTLRKGLAKLNSLAGKRKKRNR
jgi:hypothetical protein